MNAVLYSHSHERPRKSIEERYGSKPARLGVSLRPGKYVIRAVAKQIKNYKKAYIYAELSESMTILDAMGADTGPGFSAQVGQGDSVERVLRVR